jgi:hypothetical protein
MKRSKEQVKEMREVLKQLKGEQPLVGLCLTVHQHKQSMPVVAIKRALATVFNQHNYRYQAIAVVLNRERTTVGHYVKTHEAEMRSNYRYREIYTDINLFYQNYLKETNECEL